MKILGIESSADDTGVALIEAKGEFGRSFHFKVLGNERATQTVHSEYGGIYPNLAKNEHIKNLPILIERVLGPLAKPDAIAVTVGPGLEPCLWTGISAAKELAQRFGVPLVPVNHMEGHILISTMEFYEGILKGTREGRLSPNMRYRALALLLSGGHTELILMKKYGQYEYLGRTRDDAVGEAFDKVARMLGLPYPGGPEISRLATSARAGKVKADFKLPRPMMHEDTYDFSFSGLKTAVERHAKAHPLNSLDREKLAREFEDAVTDVILYKTLRAAEEHSAHTLVMGGGVSANTHIRETLAAALESTGGTLLVCPPEHSTDNALMIAIAGYFRAQKEEFVSPETIVANGTLRLVQ